eukprot:127895_1
MAVKFMLYSVFACIALSKMTCNLPVSTETPTANPTIYPSAEPTPPPTNQPTFYPTDNPTDRPTDQPTTRPTNKPTEYPTKMPTEYPTKMPTEYPTNKPTEFPTPQPTKLPTKLPTNSPTNWPTKSPTNWPTDWPTTKPPTKKSKSWPTEAPIDSIIWRRRLLDTLYSGLNPEKSCIMIDITVDVENVLPDPTIADPSTNIWLLGDGMTCAFQAETELNDGGKIQIPGRDYVLSDEERTNWIVDEECLNIDNTVTNKYFSDTVDPKNETISCYPIQGTDRVYFEFTFDTKDSIMYTFSLPNIEIAATT